MLHKSKEMRAKRAEIATLINANLAEIQKEETTEARRQELLAANDKAFVDVDTLRRSIDQIELAADLESELDTRGASPGSRSPRMSKDPAERVQQIGAAIETFYRLGYEGLSDEGRSILRPADLKGMTQAVDSAMRDMRGMVRESRDLATTTSGVVIPTEYWNELEKSMLAFGGMRTAAKVIRTGGGGTLTFPTVNDTSNSATLVTEATQTTTSVDPTFSSMSLAAFTYRSFSLVAREFMQDWQFDVASYINEALATRLARGLNTVFTTGDGSSKPNGVVTATTSSGTMGSGTAVTITDLTELLHSVDPDYRTRARWMFHDTMLRNLRRMVDTNGQPLWQPGIAGGSPDSIYTYPYTINQAVAQPTSAGSKVLLFGDFQKYIIRDVTGVEAGPVILRLNERYADYGQVGFFLFSRHDGDLLDAGTDPIRCMTTGSPQS